MIGKSERKRATLTFHLRSTQLSATWTNLVSTLTQRSAKRLVAWLFRKWTNQTESRHSLGTKQRFIIGKFPPCFFNVVAIINYNRLKDCLSVDSSNALNNRVSARMPEIWVSYCGEWFSQWLGPFLSTRSSNTCLLQCLFGHSDACLYRDEMDFCCNEPPPSSHNNNHFPHKLFVYFQQMKFKSERN